MTVGNRWDRWDMGKGIERRGEVRKGGEARKWREKAKGKDGKLHFQAADKGV